MTCVDCGYYRASSEHPSIRASDHLRSTESPLALTLTAVTTPAAENKQREEVAPWTTDARMVGCSDGQMTLRNKAATRQFLCLFKSDKPQRSTESLSLLTTSN